MNRIGKKQLQTHPFFLVPYYLVIPRPISSQSPKVVAANLAHAVAQMTKAKFVLRTMMLRNLAHEAKHHGRCEVLILPPPKKRKLAAIQPIWLIPDSINPNPSQKIKKTGLFQKVPCLNLEVGPVEKVNIYQLGCRKKSHGPRDDLLFNWRFQSSTQVFHRWFYLVD